MQPLTDAEYAAMVRWAEQQDWTWDADPAHVQRVWRKRTGYREQPPRGRRYRMPTGVRVNVGPVSAEDEWDWA